MINLGRRALSQLLFVGHRAPPPATGAQRIRFTSPRDALDLLRRLTTEPGQITLLRRLLAEDHATARGFDRADHQILEIVAQRLFSGQLTASVVRPPPPDHQIGAPAPIDITPGEAPEEKPRPSPIVPPEYIILARRESSETINGDRALEAKLGKLSHVGFTPLRPPSKVAGAYPSVADAEALRLQKAEGDLEAAIGLRRYAGYDKTRVPSVVAGVYPKSAEIEHKRTSVLVAGLGYRLDSLRFERHDPNRLRSSISAEYPDVAALEVKNTSHAVERLGEAVERLKHEPTRLPRASSALAGEYPSVARAEANLVGGAVLDTTRRLDDLTWVKKDLDDTPRSQVASEYTGAARAQERPVKHALEGFVSAVVKVARTDGDYREGRGPSAIAAAYHQAAEIQAAPVQRAVKGFVEAAVKVAAPATGEPEIRKPSNVAAEYRAVAAAQAAPVRAALAGLFGEIGSLARVGEKARREVESRVAGEVQRVSGDQGERAARAVKSLVNGLGQLTFPSGFDVRALRSASKG